MVIYTTSSEIIFVTCDNDKQTKNYLLEKVEIFVPNETRNIIIPNKLNIMGSYSIFLPQTEIKEIGNYQVNLTNMF